MTSRSGRTRGGMLEAVALAVLVGGCTGVPAASDPSHVSGAPLIPVTTFFANRESNYDYKVSPDGRRLAWMASAGGRLTVHFRELDGGEVGVIDTPWTRNLRTFRWATDSRHVLFEQARRRPESARVRGRHGAAGRATGRPH